MFLLGATVAHTAQLHSTAKDAYSRLLTLIRRAPHLSRLVPERLVRRSADDWSITTVEGGRVEFGPRSSRTGRGTGKDFVVYDEALYLGAEEIAGQVPTMSTRDNPQLWYTSSAGRKESEHLLSLRDRGWSGAKWQALQSGLVVPAGLTAVEPEEQPGLAYFEWSAARPRDGKPIDYEFCSDVERAKQSNPGLGKRISLHYVGNELRVMRRFPDKFGRERLSIFDEVATIGRVISENQWNACRDEGAAVTGAAVFAVTVNDERTTAAITAAGWQRDGTPMVEIVTLGPAGGPPREGDEPAAAGQLVDEPAAAAGDVDQVDEPPPPGLRWVLDWFAERKGARVVVWSASPAGALAGRLVAGGADVVKASGLHMARASQAFYDAVIGGDVAHLGDEVLGAAVAAGRKRDLAEGAWVWSPKGSSGDIGPLVGASLALDVLTSTAAERVYPDYHPDRHDVAPPAGDEVASWRRIWAYGMGLRRPLVWQCWLLDPDGVLYLEHEVYRSAEVDPLDVAREIAGLSLPRPHTVLSDTPRDMRRAFESELAVTARPPFGELADGIQAVRHRLSSNQLAVSSGRVLSVDNGLRRAARPTCVADEFAGYVWPADGKEQPCGDASGLDALRWAVSSVDLRPRARFATVG